MMMDVDLFPDVEHIHHVLDIKVEKATPDMVVIKMPVGAKASWPDGRLHGGAPVIISESAASIGGYMNLDSHEKMAVGLEINASFMKADAKGHLRATAVPLCRDETKMVWEIRVTDEDDTLICMSRCTLAVISLDVIGRG